MFDDTRSPTVDASEILRSPVEGKVVHPIIYTGFIHPKGGDESDTLD